MKTQFIRWCRAAGIRAFHTMCQTAAGVIGTSVVLSEINWLTVLSASLLAGLVSVLKSAAVGVPEVSEINRDGETVNGAYDGEDGE